MELKTGIKLDGDVVRVNGEAANLRTSRDNGVVVDSGITARARDDSVAKGAAGQQVVALREALAGPSLKAAATVVADVAGGQVAPAEARNLDLNTLVVGVGGASEGVGTDEGLEAVLQIDSLELQSKRLASSW